MRWHRTAPAAPATSSADTSVRHPEDVTAPEPLPAPAAELRVIDTADRAELERQFPELAHPLTPAYARPGSTAAVLAALDATDAVDQSGARVLAAGLGEVRAHVDALYAALTAAADPSASGGERP